MEMTEGELRKLICETIKTVVHELSEMLLQIASQEPADIPLCKPSQTLTQAADFIMKINADFHV